MTVPDHMLRQKASESRVRMFFFDARVFEPNSSPYQVHDNKFRKVFHGERLKVEHEVEHRSKTCKLHTTYIYNTCCNGYRMKNVLFQSLAIHLLTKKYLPKSMETSWGRMKISFIFIRSMLVRLRGSRSIKYNTTAINDIVNIK